MKGVFAFNAVKITTGNKLLTQSPCGHLFSGRPSKYLASSASLGPYPQLWGGSGWGGGSPVQVHTQLSNPGVSNSVSIPSWTPGCPTSRVMIFIASSSRRRFILAALFQAARIHRSQYPQQTQGWFTASVLGTASQQGCMRALQFKYFGTAQSEMHKMLMYY